MKIVDNRLLQEDIDLIQQYLDIDYSFGNFYSLGDILTKLNVDIVIEPGIVTRDVPQSLIDAKAYWENEKKRLFDEVKKGHEELKEKAYEASERFGSINYEISIWSNMPLRGLYDKNKIILYPEEMAQENGGAMMDELLISTLAHETMHAYFDRPRHNIFPYVPLVEEPLAEFGMLLFLYSVQRNYYKWAYVDVKNNKSYYRYGAKLMDQCLNEGKSSKTRKYLEDYKIKLDPNTMPTIDSNNCIELPQKGKSNTSVAVNGKTIKVRWESVYSNPPCYFYDEKTQTLCLDGEWRVNKEFSHGIFNLDINIITCVHHSSLKNVYLGDNFYSDESCPLDPLERYPVTVSPNNKIYYAVNGVPFLKKTKKPALNELADGLYRIYRDGKCGAIDGKANPITECEYGFIWSFDENGLAKVRKNGKYVLINKQGKEQGKIEYDKISKNSVGNYNVTKDGEEYCIDKNGKRL